jgi:phosphate transport system substrate-binding protein
MKILGFTILALSLVLTGGACGRSSKGALTVAGSTSIQPFAEKWAEAYRAKHAQHEIHVQGGGSTAGVQATLSGAAQIGMCSRKLKPDEETKVKAIVVARDGLTIIVHATSPITDLTTEQIQKVYTGEITKWSELGGPDKAITVVTRESGSGARGAFEELALKGKSILASALVQDSQGAVRQMVSTDPAAIGYVSHGVVDASVKALKVNGVEPGQATVASGQYPLVRPFLFLTQAEPTGAAKDFIDWILGAEGQAIAKQEGLFPPG